MLNKLEEKFDLVYYLLIYNRIFSKFPRISHRRILYLHVYVYHVYSWDKQVFETRLKMSRGRRNFKKLRIFGEISLHSKNQFDFFFPPFFSPHEFHFVIN